MDIGIPKDFMALATRIADALELHNALAKEDLNFRREQAAKGEQQQAAIFATMFPAGKIQDGAPAPMNQNRRQRRHGEGS